MNSYVVYLRRENGTCARYLTDAGTDQEAREYADVVKRARASYGEVLTVDAILRVDYVPVPLTRATAGGAK